MAEWLIEDGIAETRAIRLDGARIVAARIDWPGRLRAGLIEDAVLIHRSAGTPRGTARFASGEEALVDRLPAAASEGARLRLEVTRAAIGEPGRIKPAQARPATAPPRPAPGLADALRHEGHTVRSVRQFPPCDWDELWDEAATGTVAFAGGTLAFARTPAMTVVDVDGAASPRELALAAVDPLAHSLRRFDLGGSVAIDFPTLAARADRQAIDRALATALADWPHERTAMNGFGLVQIVSRLSRPGLLHLIAGDPAGAAARRLLRQGETITAQPGAILITGHPDAVAALRDDWIAKLARRSGRPVRVTTDPALALTGGFAQAVPL